MSDANYAQRENINQATGNNLMTMTLTLMHGSFLPAISPVQSFGARGNIVNGRPIGFNLVVPQVKAQDAKAALPAQPMTLTQALQHGRP